MIELAVRRPDGRDSHEVSSAAGSMTDLQVLLDGASRRDEQRTDADAACSGGYRNNGRRGTSTGTAGLNIAAKIPGS